MSYIQSSAIIAATQSDQEASTNGSVYVSPNTQKFHPSATKVWCSFTIVSGTPTIQSSYNVTSLTDNGVGDTVVNYTTSFSSSAYSTFGSGDDFTIWTYPTNSNSSSQGRIRTRNSSGTLTDSVASVNFSAYGDQ